MGLSRGDLPLRITKGLLPQVADQLLSFGQDIMALIVTFNASICTSPLGVLGVGLPRMIASIASSSALASSIRASLWLLRLSTLPMVHSAGAGTTCFVMAGHVWPSSFGGCKRP